MKIFDGRKSFYQWDLNQKLVVEDDRVEQVHFAAAKDTALVCPVYETEGVRVADVPNILLQSGMDIKAFAVSGERTLYSCIFPVNEREKPENYIYTETDTRSVETIVTEMLAEALSEIDLSGYVKNTDIAGSNTAGVVRVMSDYGVQLISPRMGVLGVRSAKNEEIVAKNTAYLPITPKCLDYAVKVALTTNTVALTDAEKAAARAWLGID